MTFNNAQTRKSCSFKYTRTSDDNIYACVTIQKSIPASMISYKTMKKTIQLLQRETTNTTGGLAHGLEPAHKEYRAGDICL